MHHILCWLHCKLRTAASKLSVRWDPLRNLCLRGSGIFGRNWSTGVTASHLLPDFLAEVSWTPWWMSESFSVFTTQYNINEVSWWATIQNWKVYILKDNTGNSAPRNGVLSRKSQQYITLSLCSYGNNKCFLVFNRSDNSSTSRSKLATSRGKDEYKLYSYCSVYCSLQKYKICTTSTGIKSQISTSPHTLFTCQ